MNYIVDSGFGVLMALLMLAGLIWLAQRAHWPSLQNTGEYGSPPSWWCALPHSCPSQGVAAWPHSPTLHTGFGACS